MEKINIEEVFITTAEGKKNLAQLTDEEFSSYVTELGFTIKSSLGKWSYSARQMFVDQVQKLVSEALNDDESF